jgi:hypothetical protein
MDLGLLGWVNTWVQSCGSVIEALVSDLIDHLLSILLYYFVINYY